jgi:hypothetical protein
MTLFTHPISTFFAGMAVALGGIAWLLGATKMPNNTASYVESYHREIEKSSYASLEAESPAEVAALNRFKGFLMGIGNAKYIAENTLKVYSSEAYLDDTLVIHHGAAKIEDYFVKTAGKMTHCEVKIDQVARSGVDYYVRWTMIFEAPALSGGQAVHSIGVSQVRFNREGKVVFHQDFWDAGRNFFGQLPIAGSVEGFIRKRLE